MGPHPARFVRDFDRGARARAPRAAGSQMDSWPDLMALLLILHACCASRGPSRRSSSRVMIPASLTSAPRSTLLSTRALATDLRAGLRPPRAEAARRHILLPAPFCRKRVQTAQPVPALDGSSRRDRFGCLDPSFTGAPHCSARHACHPLGALSSADPLHEPWLENGVGNHRVTPERGSRRTRSATTLPCATSG
jgi:hypothetical protein